MNSAILFFLHIDRRDWAAVRAALTDEVVTDYSSLFGGAAETLAADDLVARWRALLPGFDATQHLLGPLAAVPGETSVLECSVRGYHRLGEATWMVAGRYRLTMRDDRIAGIVLETAYQEGDLSLPEQAAARDGRGQEAGR